MQSNNKLNLSRPMPIALMGHQIPDRLANTVFKGATRHLNRRAQITHAPNSRADITWTPLGAISFHALSIGLVPASSLAIY